MRIHVFALATSFAVCGAGLTNAAATKLHHRKHVARPVVVRMHPEQDFRSGWNPDGYPIGTGGTVLGDGVRGGLRAGALIGGGLTAPYYDFTNGYPPGRRPWGYPYVAFPYFIGYPYYNIPYGHFRPPSPR
jgi:hypothetical protein